MKVGLILVVFLLWSCQGNHHKLGIEFAKKELQKALAEKSIYPTLPKRTINNKQTAIEIAEPVLFKVYGKQEIINERPYEIYLISGYWILNGTINTQLGGGFVIILDSKDSRVMRLTHYK